MKHPEDEQLIKDWDVITAVQVDAFLKEGEAGGSFAKLVKVFGIPHSN